MVALYICRLFGHDDDDDWRWYVTVSDATTAATRCCGRIENENHLFPLRQSSPCALPSILCRSKCRWFVETNAAYFRKDTIYYCGCFALIHSSELDATELALSLRSAFIRDKINRKSVCVWQREGLACIIIFFNSLFVVDVEINIIRCYRSTTRWFCGRISLAAVTRPLGYSTYIAVSYIKHINTRSGVPYRSYIKIVVKSGCDTHIFSGLCSQRRLAFSSSKNDLPESPEWKKGRKVIKSIHNSLLFTSYFVVSDMKKYFYRSGI